MSKHISMTAVLRDRAGKGNARATRRQGKVPAVIYGDNKAPVLIAIDNLPIIKALQSGQLFTQLCDLTVDGQKHLVLARDVQFHPVKDTPDHVDFLRVSEKTIITADVPVVTINEEESPGIKARGIASLLQHTLQVSCRADQIPQSIEIDLTGLELGAVIKVEDLKLPKNVNATADGQIAVLSIVAPKGASVDEDAEESSDEAAEPEVTAQKGDKEEA